MFCFIKLTQRAKRKLSIDFQIQGTLPKIQMIRSRASTSNKYLNKKKSVTQPLKYNQKSPKTVFKPITNDFQFFKLQTSEKRPQEAKYFQGTPKKQLIKLPSLEFSVSGFETTDVEKEDLFLFAYAKQQ
ncbi:unnamed protein product [Paramecium sonneborni]|uniref:Uncharacterized protein n=1 Tax=Paramecium sonneborni TaxID=65129 RepID=A0A8S1R389_9CILI|nr:unnamed protein product [Paramecium sonneborni]